MNRSEPSGVRVTYVHTGVPRSKAAVQPEQAGLAFFRRVSARLLSDG